MENKFDHAMQEYLDACRAANPTHKFEIQPGRKYERIVHTFSGQLEIFAFVDPDTGDILKPATWSQPTKRGIRGNIFTTVRPLRTKDFYIFNIVTPEHIMMEIEQHFMDGEPCKKYGHTPDGNGFCAWCNNELAILEINIR